MRIVSWNVNGLRAVLARDALAWAWHRQPDVLCLQEIKARPEQIREEQRAFPGYQAIWNPAERPGYSGVATLLREPAREMRTGMDDRDSDLEGRVIQTLHPRFRLFNVYFPNGGRGEERLRYKLDFYARLLELCDDLHARGESIIITGDFNTAHQPIDLKYPRQNQNISGFLPEERAWVQKFLEHGFVDIYRHLYPDRVQYTWWTYRVNARQRGIGWRLDYFLVSESLLAAVRDVVIHEQVSGSDHCPVELEID
jgi:exodeoxyribonuclease-3